MADTKEQSFGVTLQPEPRGDAAEPYRPLSLLALCALVLAVLFAGLVVLGGLVDFAKDNLFWFLVLVVLAALFAPLRALFTRQWEPSNLLKTTGLSLGLLATVLGLGGLVAYSSRTYWSWPGTVWPLPLAALVCAWVANLRIKASEDTLSGADLAKWAARLTFFFGLCYVAYLASSTFAVRGQARECAEKYLDLIKKGDLLAAFTEAMPPKSRPRPEESRLKIEVVNNMPRGPGDPGKYTGFVYAPHVLLIQQSGEKANWEMTNVESHFERGGFTVVMTFKVSTIWSRFTLVVTAKGEEEMTGSSRRRQWYVELDQSFSRPESHQLTEEGKTLGTSKEGAIELVREWAQRIFQNNLDAAYRDTLESEQRLEAATLDELIPALTGITLRGVNNGSPQQRAELLRKRQAFREGGFVDVKDFVCSPALSSDLLSELKQVFSAKQPDYFDIGLLPRVEIPSWKIEGDQVMFNVAVRMITGKPREPRFHYEGEVTVVGPKTSKPLPARAYRVVGLRWLRGMTAAKPQMPGKG